MDYNNRGKLQMECELDNSAPPPMPPPPPPSATAPKMRPPMSQSPALECPPRPIECIKIESHACNSAGSAINGCGSDNGNGGLFGSVGGDIGYAAAFVAFPYLGGIGATLAIHNEISDWFEGVKPSWSPPSWAFAPIWTTLYATMGFASYLVWRDGGGFCFGRAKAPLLLYGTQLALNWAWPYIFFKSHSVGTAMTVSGALWFFVAATTCTFSPINPTAGCLMLPYLLWVTITGAINFKIWQDEVSGEGEEEEGEGEEEEGEEGEGEGESTGTYGTGTKASYTGSQRTSQRSSQRSSQKSQSQRSSQKSQRSSQRSSQQGSQQGSQVSPRKSQAGSQAAGSQATGSQAGSKSATHASARGSKTPTQTGSKATTQGTKAPSEGSKAYTQGSKAGSKAGTQGSKTATQSQRPSQYSKPATAGSQAGTAGTAGTAGAGTAGAGTAGPGTKTPSSAATAGSPAGSAAPAPAGGAGSVGQA